MYLELNCNLYLDGHVFPLLSIQTVFIGGHFSGLIHASYKRYEKKFPEDLRICDTILAGTDARHVQIEVPDKHHIHS